MHIAAKVGSARQRCRASPGHACRSHRSFSLLLWSFILDASRLRYYSAMITNGSSRQQLGAMTAAAAADRGGGGAGATAYTGVVRRADAILTLPPGPFVVGRLWHTVIPPWLVPLAVSEAHQSTLGTRKRADESMHGEENE